MAAKAAPYSGVHGPRAPTTREFRRTGNILIKYAIRTFALYMLRILLVQTMAFCTILLVQQWVFSRIVHIGTDKGRYSITAEQQCGWSGARYHPRPFYTHCAEASNPEGGVVWGGTRHYPLHPLPHEPS